MKVLEKRILVEEIMTKIERKVILTPGKDKEPDNYEIKRKVIDVGEDVNTIVVGDIPIFGTYSQPAAIKTISKDDKGMIVHCVYDLDNVVAIEKEVKEVK